MIDLQILRVLSVLLLGAVGYFSVPFNSIPLAAAGVGAAYADCHRSHRMETSARDSRNSCSAQLVEL